MAVWSKLQKSLYNLVTDKINFQMHCSVYRMNSGRGSVNLPRYWITIDKKIIFDYPKQFVGDLQTENYPYETEISNISKCIRDYIDCSVNLLPYAKFERDKWGITDIFKAVDKRLGKEKLKAYFSSCSEQINEILVKRFEE